MNQVIDLLNYINDSNPGIYKKIKILVFDWIDEKNRTIPLEQYEKEILEVLKK